MPRTPADLKRTFLALDHLYSDDRCAREGVTVKWKRYRKAKNFIMFGDYDGELKEIRLNWRLAQDDVPNYVVQAIVWHEMCHHIYGYDHTVEFHKAEAQFIRFWESEAFCDKLVISETSLED